MQTEALNQLELALEHASSGDDQATTKFFEIFLQTKLFVPNRYQSQPLSNAPTYPNDFTDVLGIQDGERVIVPAFTQAEFIEEWSGQEFKYREIEVKELLKLLPEGWWLELNAGQEVGKDFSPWEIDHLKLGPESIPIVASELASDDISTPLETQPIPKEELPTWLDQLSSHAERNESVQAMFILREIRKNIEDELVTHFLIGVELAEGATEPNTVRDEIQFLAEKQLIGAEPVRTFIGDQAGSSVALKVFKGCEPFYASSSYQQSKKGSWLGNLLSPK